MLAFETASKLADRSACDFPVLVPRQGQQRPPSPHQRQAVLGRHRSLGSGTGDDDVVGIAMARVAAQLLGAPSLHLDFGQFQRRHGVAQEFGLALVRFDQTQAQPGQRELERDPRKAAAGANIGNAFVAAEAVGIENRQRPQDQLLPGRGGVADGGQVEAGVALQEQLQVAVQPGVELGPSREGQAPGNGRGPKPSQRSLASQFAANRARMISPMFWWARRLRCNRMRLPVTMTQPP